MQYEKRLQENADNGIATIGINNDRIVILSATDEESEATLDIAAVLSLSEKRRHIQYMIYSFIHIMTLLHVALIIHHFLLVIVVFLVQPLH